MTTAKVNLIPIRVRDSSTCIPNFVAEMSECPNRRGLHVKGRSITWTWSKDRNTFWGCLTQDHPVSFSCQLLFPTLSSHSNLPSVSYYCDSCPPHWLSVFNPKMTPCIATFTFHPYNMSLPIALSTWDAPRAALDAPLLCSQLLPKEENGSSSCCNTTCIQSAAKEACNLFTVMYSFQQREHQRIQLRWSPALLEERAPLSRSLAHILGLGIT